MRAHLSLTIALSFAERFVMTSGTHQANGNWYTCNEAERIESVTRDLKTIRVNEGMCFETYFKVVKPYRTIQRARLMGQHGAHLGPVGPRWAPCWPHEPCYQGSRSSNENCVCYHTYQRISTLSSVTKCPRIPELDVYSVLNEVEQHI